MPEAITVRVLLIFCGTFFADNDLGLLACRGIIVVGSGEVSLVRYM